MCLTKDGIKSENKILISPTMSSKEELDARALREHTERQKAERQREEPIMKSVERRPDDMPLFLTKTIKEAKKVNMNASKSGTKCEAEEVNINSASSSGANQEPK